MMEILLIIVLAACLGALIWLGIRKLPQIRVVDPSSSKEAKSREVKYAILKQRLERMGSEKAQTLKRDVLVPVGTSIQNAVRRAAGKLTALERRYAERQKGVEQAHNPEVLRELVREAEVLMDEERFDAAEKKLIEVVSHDPKNVAAYEHLGRLYFMKKDYQGARETFQFLLKLSPKDASVLAALGEVAEAEGKADDAMAFYKDALDISPNNPKYLDFYIDAAINAEDVHEATTALERLRDANQENQKIPEFEDRIAEVREKKKRAA
ncbi:tetratricopeptide repeat protein [Candidatus Uhrbacteria bacterium]|nr:tetratricopeptide repeat protein [Candidatus Uhrbacteria bacterium]